MKTMKTEIFAHEEFGQVRVIREGDTFLFCGVDVAKALGYAKPQNAVRVHCKGALKRGTLTKGGTQELLFIPEGDVYRLIIGSKLPTAERFERWLFDEVLPSIRKYGAYLTPEMQSKLSRNPSYIQELVDMLQHEEALNSKLMCQLSAEKDQTRLMREKIQDLEQASDELNEENDFLTCANNALYAVSLDMLPKADYYDAFVEPGENTSLTLTAKELGISPRGFIKLLEKSNYLYRTKSGALIARQEWIDAGYFVVKEWGHGGHTAIYSLVTPAGKLYFHRILHELFLAQDVS